MGAVSAIRKALARSTSFEATIDNPFLHFDVNGVASDLRLGERGAENGAQDLPASDAGGRDAVELEISNRVSRAWQEAAAEADRWFLACDQRISNLSLLTQLPTIESSAIQTESQIKAEVAQATMRLTTARDAVAQSYRQLLAFQRDHKLHRPANLSPSLVLTYGTILLTWIVETAANSMLLRQNDDFGLLGGIGAAAVVGGINIGVAVFAGRNILPQLNLRSRAWPVFVALSAVWGLFLLLWNLFAAHYRDAKVSGVEAPEFAAVGMMTQLPASIYSWGLLILGIIFAIIASIAAYRMRDPFPGYADVWREHERRCADYAGEIEAASDELRALHDDASEGFTDIRTGLARQLADQSRAVTGRNAFAQRLARYHAELEQAGRQLLAIYRDRNRAARSTPPPAHFESGFSLAPPLIPPTPEAAIKPADVERGDHILASAQRGISDTYLAGVQSFETLEALKARLHA
ncbi:MAG: hypothetical protein H2055_03795 [Sphingopyxis sp.]|uniref:hypothetical protein n=1 Tax=Blastomonas sp. TaxID=1909299 RepID=UPI0017EAAE3A|nr:hypothetical protein [Sphingopyxis sp.]